MIIDQANSLHKGVDDGGTNEGHAALFKIF